MKILAISGSTRAVSTNTALLRAFRDCSGTSHQITVFDRLGSLPVFSPDLEATGLPKPVAEFVGAIAGSDGLVIASPEYVRSIPGGLKNAIDWLVSRDEIIGKPIALMHASHRGDDMLDQLRNVLGTVSDRFTPDIFVRFSLTKQSPEEIAQTLSDPQMQRLLNQFLDRFCRFCAMS